MSQFCISCGVENSDEAKFCKSCGEKLTIQEYDEFDKEIKINPFSLLSPSGCVSRKTYLAVTFALIAIPFVIGILMSLVITGTIMTDLPQFLEFGKDSL